MSTPLYLTQALTDGTLRLCANALPCFFYKPCRNDLSLWFIVNTRPPLQAIRLSNHTTIQHNYNKHILICQQLSEELSGQQHLL